MPFVSIVIPVKKINDYIRESIIYIEKLDYPGYEVLIFPDIESDEIFPQTRIIPTGHISPAEKRDLALKYAKGDILAFLDDDAYPKADWLEKALTHFDNPAVAAVGGPAVTPESDNLLPFFVIFLIFVPVGGLYLKWIFPFYKITLALYLFLVLINVVKIKRFPLAFLTALGIISTHITYGVYFLKGLFTKESAI